MSNGWETFVREGARLSQETARAVEAAVDAPEQLEGAIAPLMALEMDAAVVGVPEVQALSESLRRRLEHVGATEATGEQWDTLRAAAEALSGAFAELARPDASGAHLDAERLEQATQALDQGLVLSPPPRLAPPPPPPAEPDDTLWQPTVDADMVDPFLDECQERLEGLAERLVELERAPEDEELIRAIFRDLHTLKGSSAFVGLRRMTRLAHAAEDLVGLVREGRRAADRPLIDALLGALDGLTAIVQRASARAPIDVDVTPLLARLERPGQGPAPPPVSTDTPSAAAAGAGPSTTRQQTLRIDFEKLDLLLNLVGELVLAKGRLGLGIAGLGSLSRELDDQRRNAASALVAGRMRRARAGAVRSEDLATEIGRIQRAFGQLNGELDAASQQLDFVAAELRDQVMKLRMLPIGRTWSKYHRTVREIAHKLGKRVRLDLVGAETELDKVLVEQLDDPFLHLVRNAIDHGIEDPAAREAAGKDPEGTVRLWAGHRGNQIVIRIEDDGKGIDADRVRAKALEKGLIDGETAATLEPSQVVDLIFRAGFSTAGAVSDLSGRGVGMDVVRDTISRLKGTVAVESTEGQGSRFEIRLPLTLAIVQVLLVRSGGEAYAIPVDVVVRTISTEEEAIRMAAGREVLFDGREDVPLLRLRYVLGLPAVTGDIAPGLSVVLVDVGGTRYGLVCDGFIGRQEIVIKSLGSLLSTVRGAAGATLVGERCVLILDVPAIIEMAVTAPARPRAGRHAAPRVVPPGEAARILVAEDSDVIRESIRRVLSAAGYDVVAARDGVEALALAQGQTFDLVSTDVVMPNMDGYELTRRLREIPELHDVPIIMVTSKEEAIDRIRGFDAGVDAYLTKPTDAAELLQVVARHLPSALPGPDREP